MSVPMPCARSAISDRGRISTGVGHRRSMRAVAACISLLYLSLDVRVGIVLVKEDIEMAALQGAGPPAPGVWGAWPEGVWWEGKRGSFPRDRGHLHVCSLHNVLQWETSRMS